MSTAAFDRTHALATIRSVGIIPVIRADSADSASRIAEALVAGGLGILEVTMTVPGANTVMTELSRRFGSDVLLGAGTVTSAEMVEAALDAGCAFIVTPCVVPEVIRAARAFDVAVIGGALTPTEVFETHRAGADMVKVFPVGPVGGPAYIRALKGPFPTIEIVATGGIGLDAVAAYFAAGAAAIGAGGELISRSAVKAGDFAAISQSARAFVDAARQARPSTHTSEGAVR